MYRFGFGLAALAVAAVFLVSNASSQPPGGKDGKDGKGGVPRFELGQVIPPPLRAEMKLTPEQEKQIDDLKNELKGKLSKILTPEQIKAIQRDLLGLAGSSEGDELFKRIGINGFDTSAQERMAELLKWLDR